MNSKNPQFDPGPLPEILKISPEARSKAWKEYSPMRNDDTATAAEATADTPAAVKAKGAKAVKAAKAPTKAPVKAAGKPAKVAPAKAAPKVKAASKPAKAPAKAKESTVAKDEYGFRKGSLKSQAAAMYARKTGSTLEEVKTKLGSTQLNVLKELEESGYKVTKTKVERKGQRPITRYQLGTK